jgi:formamidopyrimidine-DNA glycosylase
MLADNFTMPELPEVETVVRGLRPRLVGARLRRVIHLDARSVRTGRSCETALLKDKKIRAVERLGKFIRIEMDNDAILVAHLGMTGRFVIVPREQEAEAHTHLRVAFSPHDSAFRASLPAFAELRFRNPRWCMGGLWFLRGPSDPADPTAKLGPDPLAISEGEFVALLGGARRQIKALLLDQTAIAGVGNIYADESLFAAGIHPRATSDRLSRPRRRCLWAAMRDRLTESIRRGGSTLRDYRNLDGDVGWFQLSLAVYGKPGAPCPACGKPITHATVAGRSTHFCTRCQRF